MFWHRHHDSHSNSITSRTTAHGTVTSVATTAAPNTVGLAGGAWHPDTVGEECVPEDLSRLIIIVNPTLGLGWLNSAMDAADLLPLQQHPHYAAALRATGCDMREIELPGAAPVQTISRYGLTLASRGPIWRHDLGPDTRNDLRRSGLHVINSEGHDLPALRRAGFRQIHGPGYVAELALHTTPEAQMATMKSKWRNTLRRARAAAFRIKVERFAPHRHGWLLAVDTVQQRAKRFRSLPHAVLEAYGAAQPHEALVFVAYLKRRPISAMVFLIHGHVATYHLGWSDEDGRAQAAHHAILAHASDHLAQAQVVRLDLGTVDTVNTPGLARFKIGTGAVVRPLGGTWLRVPWL